MESEQKKKAGETLIFFVCRFAECAQENAVLKGTAKEAGRARKYQVEKMMVEAVGHYKKFTEQKMDEIRPITRPIVPATKSEN